MQAHEEETAAAVRKGKHTAAAETGGGILGAIAEVGCQLIEELRIRWRL